MEALIVLVALSVAYQTSAPLDEEKAKGVSQIGMTRYLARRNASFRQSPKRRRGVIIRRGE
jgi:hypothetical protein